MAPRFLSPGVHALFNTLPLNVGESVTMTGKLLHDYIMLHKTVSLQTEKDGPSVLQLQGTEICQ